MDRAKILSMLFVMFFIMPVPVIFVIYFINKEWTETHRITAYGIGVAIGAMTIFLSRLGRGTRIR